MYIALNKYRERVHIKNANPNEDYICPLCEYQLCIRDGDIRQKHFAHKPGAYNYCDDIRADEWKSDMSEWHMNWQTQFPIECQEVVLERNGEKHRADVKVGNVIIEFQHSPISKEAFEKRNRFYTSTGCKLIWLFDLSEDYEDKKYITWDLLKDCYKWKQHKRNFNGYDLSNNKDITIFFQFRSNPDEDKGLVHLVSLSDDCRSFKIEKDLDYNREEFVYYINHYEEKKKEKKVMDLYEILEACYNEEAIIVQNEINGRRYYLSNIMWKKSHMHRHPGDDIFGYLCYEDRLGFYKEKEYALKRSRQKIWTVVWCRYKKR